MPEGIAIGNHGRHCRGAKFEFGLAHTITKKKIIKKYQPIHRPISDDNRDVERNQNEKQKKKTNSSQSRVFPFFFTDTTTSVPFREKKKWRFKETGFNRKNQNETAPYRRIQDGAVKSISKLKIDFWGFFLAPNSQANPR